MLGISIFVFALTAVVMLSPSDPNPLTPAFTYQFSQKGEVPTTRRICPAVIAIGCFD
jgi:hypothetical protein